MDKSGTMEAGFGLTELLISLFLSTFLLMMLGQLYLSTKKVYLEVADRLAVEFDVQWVSDLLRDSIRRAGFTPCMSVEHLNTIDTRNGRSVIRGLHIDKTVDPLIQVNRMHEEFYDLIKVAGANQILVSHHMQIRPKRPLIIADCHHAEIHTITAVRNLGKERLITLSQPLRFAYATESYVGEWLEEKWYIKRKNNGVNTLYYQSGHPEELTELIHTLFVKDSHKKGKRVLEVTLGLDNEQIKQLTVVVRGS